MNDTHTIDTINALFGHLINFDKRKPIFHSLAQFAFNDRRKDRYKIFREGLLVLVAVKNEKIASISFVPSWREDDNFVRLYDPDVGKGRELLGYLKSVNEGVLV